MSYKWVGKEGWTIKKVSAPRSDVKLDVNDRVRAWIDYFTGPGRERFGRYLQRAARYRPLMQEILRQHNVPDDVIHIALIESGFTASATSHASAVGFWQFIGSTGRRYGLRIDPYVDERRDFVKATHAAANYLADLYNEFGDWYLAFAGYNSGEGKVRSAIQKYGTKNFWKLTERKNRHFRAETKDYVPKFIAATIIARDPKRYGFHKLELHEPIQYDVVKAATQTDFRIIAKCSRGDEEEIAMLNPELIMGITPPDESNYKIRVPKGNGDRFLRTFASLSPQKRLSGSYMIATAEPSRHTVQRGESLSRIARKYKTTAHQLMAANNITRAKNIFPGQTLIIPGKVSKHRYHPASGSSERLTVAAVKTEPKATTTKISYMVQKGDTLGAIAERHGVTVSDLVAWNKIQGNRIFSGKKLRIYGEGATSTAAVPEQASEANTGVASGDSTPATKTVAKTESVKYTVKSGDTLGGIAKANRVKVSDIQGWNNLKGSMIRPGQSLTVGKKSIQVEVPMETVAAVSDTVGVPKTPPRSGKKGDTYKVERGDSWWSVAEKNGLTVAELRQLNPETEEMLKIGQRIRIAENVPTTGANRSEPPAVAEEKDAELPPPAGATEKPFSEKTAKASTYQVRSGDTLYSISRGHGISVAELTRLNNINRQAVLCPGMKLKVAGLAADKAPSPEPESSDRLMLSSAAPAESKDYTPVAEPIPESVSEPTTSSSAESQSSAEMSEIVSYKVKSGDTAWDIARKHNVSITDIQSWNDSADLKKLKPGDIIKLKLAEKKDL